MRVVRAGTVFASMNWSMTSLDIRTARPHFTKGRRPRSSQALIVLSRRARRSATSRTVKSRGSITTVSVNGDSRTETVDEGLIRRIKKEGAFLSHDKNLHGGFLYHLEVAPYCFLPSPDSGALVRLTPIDLLRSVVPGTSSGSILRFKFRDQFQ